MDLSPNAFIAPEKLNRYLFVPQPDSDKSKWLESAGYTVQNWQRLEQDIRSQLLSQPAQHIETTGYGEVYKINGPLMGPNERTLQSVVSGS